METNVSTTSSATRVLSVAFSLRVQKWTTYLLVLQDTGCSREILRLSPSARTDIHAVNLRITAVLGQGLVVWRVRFSHNRLKVAEVVALLGVVSRLLKKQPHRRKWAWAVQCVQNKGEIAAGVRGRGWAGVHLGLTATKNRLPTKTPRSITSLDGALVPRHTSQSKPNRSPRLTDTTCPLHSDHKKS